GLGLNATMRSVSAQPLSPSSLPLALARLTDHEPVVASRTEQAAVPRPSGTDGAPGDPRHHLQVIVASWPRGHVERDGRGRALERDGTDLPVGDAVHLAGGDSVAHKNLSGPGVVRDPRRDVDRSAEVVAVLEDHRARVDP